MSLKERTYSILVVSSTDSFASAFIGSLPEIRYYPVLTASSVSAAKRMLKEKSFDFVIINSPLSDDIWRSFCDRPLFLQTDRRSAFSKTGYSL